MSKEYTPLQDQPTDPNQQGTQQPGLLQAQPGMYQQQPGLLQAQPGMYQQQPGMYQQQPGMYQQQPGMYQQQPGMIQQQPGMYQQQPGLLQAQPLPPCGFINFHGNQMALSSNPMVELQFAIGAKVVQEVELLEMLTNCETANRYHVFIIDQTGQAKYLFKCKESSGCCGRNFCTSDSRPFAMKLKHVISALDMNDDFGKQFATFDKPFKCTCCCLARPEMKGIIDQGKEFFGKVVQQCTLCDPLLHVFNQDKTLRYKITGSCCQCGFCCRSHMCGKLSEAKFGIYNANGQIDGKGVGQIVRKVVGLQNLISDADTFEITFPQDATPQEKLTLLGAVLLMDYMYYEESPADDKKKDKLI